VEIPSAPKSIQARIVIRAILWKRDGSAISLLDPMTMRRIREEVLSRTRPPFLRVKGGHR